MLRSNHPSPALAPPLLHRGRGEDPEPVGRGHRVLIIEDEGSLGRNIKDYLEEDGFEAKVCGDGIGGLELFDAFQPVVVLLDLRLPGIDGLTVLERLRARDPGAKVIMMTAHGDSQTAIEARRAGALTFLAKPLVLSELRGAVVQAL